MIRVILFFAILFALFFFGFPALRSLSGLEKWNLTKTVVYSIVCSSLAVAVMTMIVILF